MCDGHRPGGRLHTRCIDGEIRPGLNVIASNLGNLPRRLVLPKGIGRWSLTSLQQGLEKTGRRLIMRACCCRLLLAESPLTRPLFRSTLRRIEALPPVAGWVRLPVEIRKVRFHGITAVVTSLARTLGQYSRPKAIDSKPARKKDRDDGNTSGD